MNDFFSDLDEILDRVYTREALEKVLSRPAPCFFGENKGSLCIHIFNNKPLYYDHTDSPSGNLAHGPHLLTPRRRTWFHKGKKVSRKDFERLEKLGAFE